MLSETVERNTSTKTRFLASCDRPYWDMTVEPLLGSPNFRDAQLGKLRLRLEDGIANSPYWRRRLHEANIVPSEITSLEKFAAAVPVFTKQDYRELADLHAGNMPAILRDLLGERACDIVAIAATSGTTGDPTPYPLTRPDLHLWGEMTRRAVWRAGLRPGDFVLQGFGLSMFLAGVPICLVLAEMGMPVIPVGAEAGASALLKFGRLFQPKGFFATPSLCEYLIQAAERERIDLKELGIKVIFCGGEPGAGIAPVRARIEAAFGATLHDFAGGLGASCGCPDYAGMHWLVDDLALMELVDPDTRELVPFIDGAEGLAVFTPLEAPGLLGIRQTNGDLMRVHTSPCRCGMSGWRYEIIGRSDDMLKVKGVMVYPVAIDAVIKSFVPRVSGEFRIVLSEPPPRVIPPLHLRVESGSETDPNTLSALADEITGAMQRSIKIRPYIEWLAPGALPRSTKKTQLIERSYES